MDKRADIEVFGGSGFYSLFDRVEEIVVPTPYGAPSDKIALATLEGKRVAFLPRHGKEHQYPPHLIPYKANLYAMRELGICYANIALITDYDAGLEGKEEIASVTEEEVLKVFAENNDKVKNLIFQMIKRMDINSNCHC